VGERAHGEAQRLRSEVAELRNTLSASVRDLMRSRALLGTVFAAAAAAGVWAGVRRRASGTSAAKRSARRAYR
jgi:hypothetical protein